MTSFLIESNYAIKDYFTDANSTNYDEKRSTVRLYRIDDVYNQIEYIVENVS